MDWLADILKDLAISKALVGAIFVTALVMYFGPIVVPQHVPALPKEYSPYLFAGVVLTSCLLTLWGAVAVWNITQIGLRKTKTALTSSSLSDPESALLFHLAKNPAQPVNLEQIDYTRALGTKLEFHQLAKGLEGKGLLRINDWDDNLISLTESGRERALELQRHAKRASAA